MQNLLDLTQQYFIDDLPGASIPSSRLRNILEDVQEGRPISDHALTYLTAQGRHSLCAFARNELSYATFAVRSKAEMSERQSAAAVRREGEEAARRAQIAESERRQASCWARQEAERLARESDPRFIAKAKSRELRAQFGLDQFIDPEDFPRVMAILRGLDRGDRLSDDDALWLATSGEMYFSHELRQVFHRRESEHFATEYRRTGDPWNAINASSYYRKCDSPREADELLTAIPAQRLKSSKIQSAVATTQGGAKRDLGQLDAALFLGNKAHLLTPRDFRPCTLLGAVNFELGNYTTGQEWYAKAVERGTSERDVDNDLRSILQRAGKVRRQEMIAFLLAEDPVRYQWVRR